jgi:hypothetical protein
MTLVFSLCHHKATNIFYITAYILAPNSGAVVLNLVLHTRSMVSFGTLVVTDEDFFILKICNFPLFCSKRLKVCFLSVYNYFI